MTIDKRRSLHPTETSPGDTLHAGAGIYETTRLATRRLVRIPSASPGRGERDAAREVITLLQEGGLDGGYTEIGLDPIPGDPYGREVAYAFLQGSRPETLVLLGHIDTVGTADYGTLESLALDPDALEVRLEDLARLAPGLREDMESAPGDWMPGRGAADMKSGVAATIAVMRRLASEGTPPISLLVLATPDEEVESVGALHGVALLHRLRNERNLRYLGLINTDYTSARYRGDPHRYFYSGTVGKLLIGAFAVGVAAHAGDPFAGFDATLILAELARELSVNPRFADRTPDHTAPPPVVLRMRDLKDQYDTQLPLSGELLLNVLTLTSGPDVVLDRCVESAREALDSLIARVSASASAWKAMGGETEGRESRGGTVLTYAELHEHCVSLVGRCAVDALVTRTLEDSAPECDKRSICTEIVSRLWTLGGLSGPAVVLFYAPPYYPHVAPSASLLREAARTAAVGWTHVNLVERGYFPLLSDMSYCRLDGSIDLAALTDNMPVWSAREGDVPVRGYTLPFDLIRDLDLPVLNIGPYGRAVHQAGERVLMSYSFDVVPKLILETVAELAARIDA